MDFDRVLFPGNSGYHGFEHAAAFFSADIAVWYAVTFRSRSSTIVSKGMFSLS
jgi:hypothetical protein